MRLACSAPPSRPHTLLGPLVSLVDGSKSAAESRRDEQMRLSEWLEALQEHTVLGHPEVWRIVDQDEWTQNFWSYIPAIWGWIISVAAAPSEPNSALPGQRED